MLLINSQILLQLYAKNISQPHRIIHGLPASPAERTVHWLFMLSLMVSFQWLRCGVLALSTLFPTIRWGKPTGYGASPVYTVGCIFLLRYLHHLPLQCDFDFTSPLEDDFSGEAHLVFNGGLNRADDAFLHYGRQVCHPARPTLLCYRGTLRLPLPDRVLFPMI